MMESNELCDLAKQITRDDLQDTAKQQRISQALMSCFELVDHLINENIARGDARDELTALRKEIVLAAMVHGYAASQSPDTVAC